MLKFSSQTLSFGHMLTNSSIGSNPFNGLCKSKVNFESRQGTTFFCLLVCWFANEVWKQRPSTVRELFIDMASCSCVPAASVFLTCSAPSRSQNLYWVHSLLDPSVWITSTKNTEWDLLDDELSWVDEVTLFVRPILSNCLASLVFTTATDVKFLTIVLCCSDGIIFNSWTWAGSSKSKSFSRSL